jgi:hypothetical protein
MEEPANSTNLRITGSDVTRRELLVVPARYPTFAA